jgi:hypothetical protein
VGELVVVYEAQQVSLGRRVALKVLPFAAALDPSQLRRFQTEAHAAAQRHHTNIVPVFSVACERGVHYYVMQFFDGRTLPQLIRDQKQTEPSRREPPRVSFRIQLAGDDQRPRPVRAGCRAGNSGRRGAEAHPPPGDRPPRHQARQLAARHPRQRLGQAKQDAQGKRIVGSQRPLRQVICNLDRSETGRTPGRSALTTGSARNSWVSPRNLPCPSCCSSKRSGESPWLRADRLAERLRVGVSPPGTHPGAAPGAGPGRRRSSIQTLRPSAPRREEKPVVHSESCSDKSA